MELPFKNAFKTERSDFRLPGLSDRKLGMYSETSVEVDFDIRNTICTYVTLGTRYAVSNMYDMNAGGRAQAQAKGQLMEYVYGPVHYELRKLSRDLFNEGLGSDSPAVKRIAKMLNTLEDGFRGDYI